MTFAPAEYYYNLGQAFAEVVRAVPDQAALQYDNATLSYAELDRHADNLAADMLDQGVAPGDVIAIGHEKRPLSFAVMLAALRLGVTYVNIDVQSPDERNARILATSAPRVLYYDTPEHSATIQSLAERQGSSAKLLSDGNLAPATEKQLGEIRAHSARVDGATIAYIMFTSGSTGIPKGVAVTHQNVLHFIAWGAGRFGTGPGTVFANLSPMYFDNSVFDFYVGLFSGAALAPVPRALLTQPYELVSYVSDRRVTLWFSVPSLLIYLVTMKALATGQLTHLRHVVFGGEGYPKAELKKLHDRFAGQAQLVNVYGPTECTCICSAHDIDEADFEDMTGFTTLGYLNPNIDYLIVDGSGEPATEGELWLIGPNVAAGYFNDPVRTAASFDTLNTPQSFMKRVYRTGDILREEDGLLYFVGRKDNQIKHMGYRIELEEIEHALASQGPVSQAAVLYQRDNAAFGKIIAFVSTSSDTDAVALTDAIRHSLPDYMIPARIFIEPDLPKNANGKVDKQQLKELLAG